VSSQSTGATGLAGRYASALFELADEAKALDEVADDLRTLRTMLDESDDLVRLVRSPVIPREEQSRAMAAVLEKAGLSDLTKRFVAVVARNRRLFVLPAMIAAYLAIIAERRGEVTAQVTAAKDLSEQQLTALGDALKAALGSNVAIDVKVDPGLLGGLVVRVGSRMVDNSLRTKLTQLRLAMKGAA
jgi:F-type H+-transporting ATPase subunit delta